MDYRSIVGPHLFFLRAKIAFKSVLNAYFCGMLVDDALIEKLAQLSMLQFNETEKEEIKSDLQKMIGFIDKLQELDTTGIEPLMHMSEEVNVLRADTVGNMLTREEALKNAPRHNGTYFQVPKVIKK